MSLPFSVAEFGASIVVLGDFNPAILSPDWLHLHQLIGAEDLDAARSKSTLLVSHQVSICDTDNFHLQALEKQLWLGSIGVPTPALKDLAEGILRLLDHTPITALGINFAGHYKFDREADYHKIGDVLAPKGVWENLFDPAHNALGLVDLQIRIEHGTRTKPEHSLDIVTVGVQPSTKFRPGIFLMLNDHRASFAQANDSSKTAAEHAADLIASEWDKTYKLANDTFEALLTNALST